MILHHRPAYLADKVYPKNKEALLQLVSKATPLESINQDRQLLVLHVPHIDYMRGLDIYGKGYQNLVGRKYDVIFLFGTCHQYTQKFAIFTEYDFISPLGTSKIDNQVFSNLTNNFGQSRALSEQNLHLTEHSLELQLPFLHLLQPETKIIPIIFGSLHHLYPDKDRFSYSDYKDLIDAIVEETNILDRLGKKYLFLAGVDMSHKGQYFGDQYKINHSDLEQIVSLDEKYLQYIEAVDPDSLFGLIASNYDSTRVCGFSTMMAISDILKKKKIQQLQGLSTNYKPTYIEHSDCLVSIASVGFYI